ncbi:CoA transferase [Mycetohabitans rhizoxinica]|uniref:CoA transferase n=1 Tax=Mycetohabitans rhizoxinica TaxID=412963 RepID=UPI0030D10839
MVLTIGNDGQFRKFCEVVHCASWATDPRFATNAARVTHRDTLIPLIQQVLNTRTIEQWIGPLTSAGVPCGPINNIAQTSTNPQVVHRGMRADLAHYWPVPCPRWPIRSRCQVPRSTTAAHHRHLVSTPNRFCRRSAG